MERRPLVRVPPYTPCSAGRYTSHDCHRGKEMLFFSSLRTWGLHWNWESFSSLSIAWFVFPSYSKYICIGKFQYLNGYASTLSIPLAEARKCKQIMRKIPGNSEVLREWETTQNFKKTKIKKMIKSIIYQPTQVYTSLLWKMFQKDPSALVLCLFSNLGAVHLTFDGVIKCHNLTDKCLCRTERSATITWNRELWGESLRDYQISLGGTWGAVNP